MKKLILLLGILGIFLISCNNTNNQKYINGWWELHEVHLNHETGDTIYHMTIPVNFTDTGYIILANINAQEYYVKGDSIISFFNYRDVNDGWKELRNANYLNIIDDTTFMLDDGKPVMDTIKLLKPEFAYYDYYNPKSDYDWFKRMLYLETIRTNPEYPYETIIRATILQYKRLSEPKEEIYDRILINLSLLNSEETSIHINSDNKSVLSDGAIFIDFNIYGNSYYIEPKVKETIDRTLGALPERERRLRNSNNYRWETSDMRVSLNCYHEYDYLYVKLWIRFD